MAVAKATPATWPSMAKGSQVWIGLILLPACYVTTLSANLDVGECSRYLLRRRGGLLGLVKSTPKLGLEMSNYFSESKFE